MKKKLGRPFTDEGPHRYKFTTKLNGILIKRLKLLAKKLERRPNELIEEALEGYWKLKK